MERNSNVKSIAETGIFMAIVFIGVYFIKIPSPGGYAHIGDSMIFLTVLFLGTKRGAIASGVGAAIADILGGYMVWVIPTLVFKGVMAYVMGTLITKKAFGLHGRALWIVSAIIGGIAQSIGYTIVRAFVYGPAIAVASIAGLAFQVISGVIIALVLSEALRKTALKDKFAFDIF